MHLGYIETLHPSLARRRPEETPSSTTAAASLRRSNRVGSDVAASRRARPGSTCMPRSTIARALSAWRRAIGTRHVSTEVTALEAAATATFATTQRVLAILAPRR